jgi:hypothetical protein
MRRHLVMARLVRATYRGTRWDRWLGEALVKSEQGHDRKGWTRKRCQSPYNGSDAIPLIAMVRRSHYLPQQMAPTAPVDDVEQACHPSPRSGKD